MHYEDKKTGFKFDAVSGLPKENTAEAFEELFGANKAAEEGGLPDLRDWIIRNMPVGMVVGDPAWWADRIVAQADRASRQVANKAEVDLSSLKRFDVNYDQGGVFFSASEFGEYYKVSDVEALLATPPATTGASTVLTDERIEWILRDLGVKAADRGEPMTSIAFARAIEREVAAQAGQVAVPGWTWAPDLKVADDEVIFYSQINQTATGLPVMTDSSQHSTWNVASVFKRPAEGVNSRDPLYVIPVEPFAPSPAKESK